MEKSQTTAQTGRGIAHATCLVTKASVILCAVPAGRHYFFETKDLSSSNLGKLIFRVDSKCFPECYRICSHEETQL